MAVETSTEKKVCSSCGADIRPNTTFCYNCGAAVGEISSTQNTEVKVGNEKDGKQNAINSAAQAIDKPIEKPFAEPLAIKKESPKIEEKKTEQQSQPVLKTAASMRRQPKSTQPKSIEVIWERPENSTSIWFVIFALVLLLLAAGAILAMHYLK